MQSESETKQNKIREHWNMEKVNETSKTQTTEAKIYAGIKSEIGTEMKLAEALEATKGTIFNIQHFCIHDGPGIRTNVFVKGCPLRCLWCANPESQMRAPQLMYRKDKCVACGACLTACPRGAIAMGTDVKVHTDRTLCTGCGACVPICPADAREISGYSITAGETFHEVQEDRLFYGDDGGVTITGGEALAQPEFTLALLQLCREDGISTAIETCGAVSWEVLRRAGELCDVILYDIKHMDDAQHRQGTGQGNTRILENLRHLSRECACDIWVRVPIIPGYNDSEENIRQLSCFVKENLTHCSQVHLLPFHTLGEGKFEELENAPNGFSSHIPSGEHMERLRDIIRSFGIICK